MMGVDGLLAALPWLGPMRQESHLATRVVTPRLSPEGIKSEASWVQLAIRTRELCLWPRGKAAMPRMPG